MFWIASVCFWPVSKIFGTTTGSSFAHSMKCQFLGIWTWSLVKSLPIRIIIPVALFF